MMNIYRVNTTPIGSIKKKEDPGLIERGIFIQEDRPEYCGEYEGVVKKAMGE